MQSQTCGDGFKKSIPKSNNRTIINVNNNALNKKIIISNNNNPLTPNNGTAYLNE